MAANVHSQMRLSQNLSLEAERKRKARASSSYGKNEAGKWVQKRSFRECDYTEAGHLVEFDSQEACNLSLRCVETVPCAPQQN